MDIQFIHNQTKGTLVNRTLPSLHEGLLEIKLSVRLKELPTLFRLVLHFQFPFFNLTAQIQKPVPQKTPITNGQFFVTVNPGYMNT